MVNPWYDLIWSDIQEFLLAAPEQMPYELGLKKKWVINLKQLP